MPNVPMSGPMAGAIHIGGKDFKPTGGVYQIPQELVSIAETCGLDPILSKSASGVPTVNDIPVGQFRVWKNTGDASVKLYYNDSGTLKSVALT